MDRWINRGITILYHPHQCRPSKEYFLLKFAISRKGGVFVVQTYEVNYNTLH